METTYGQDLRDLTQCHRKHLEAIANSTDFLHQILIQMGMTDENTYDIAADLIHSFGSLRGVCFSSAESLITASSVTATAMCRNSLSWASPNRNETS